MDEWFEVDGLDVERLLIEWRWLYARKVALVARSVFGDLFLRDETGAIVWLDSAIGRLKTIAESESHFRELAKLPENQQEWFGETDAEPAAVQGVRPGKLECIAFKTPLVFSQSRDVPNNAYIGNVYKHVSFLGSLNRQIAELPDGAQVRLVIDKEPIPPAS